LGVTTETTTLMINNVKTGNDFTAHSNGSQTFNNNGTCFSKLISASTCVGISIVIGSNTYPITNINGQCWMTTNLNELPNGVAVNATQWLATSPGDLGYYGYYNTAKPAGTSGWATAVPAANEGLLYQWSAAMLGSTTERAQGVCPTGWHIPSDCEWMYLEHGQGMIISSQITNSEWRSTTGEGNKLRSVGTGATNTSGFTALLAGYRNTDGAFYVRGSYGYWWSSSEAGATNAQHRALGSGQAGVLRSSLNKAFGFSVRCLKD
jgi:uncharacterized protein (TIGR02145 family)